MRTATVFIVLLSIVAGIASAGDPAGKITFKEAGFSISPLDEPQKGPAQQVLIMCLPASDGFAANVNVQIQPYTNSIDTYVTMSRMQFKDLGFKVLSETRPDKLSVTFEYSGTIQGESLHWYARAAQKGGTIYLATATATEDQWPKLAAKLKACVNSLETAPRAAPGK